MDNIIVAESAGEQRVQPPALEIVQRSLPMNQQNQQAIDISTYVAYCCPPPLSKSLVRERCTNHEMVRLEPRTRQAAERVDGDISADEHEHHAIRALRGGSPVHPSGEETPEAERD